MWPRGGPLLASLLLLGCARTAYFQPDARPPAEAATPLPAAADSAHNLTAGRQYARHGGLYRVFFGAHHRTAWATPVTAQVLDLATAVPGGLRPSKLGGGFNSTSLALTDTAGHAWVLRTVDKDPARAVPRWLRGTALVNYLRDNVSATHPYAALVVPPLAEAVGVAHTTPRLFYAPASATQLPGDSLQKLRGQLVLLEEKFDGRGDRPGLPRNTVRLLDSRELFRYMNEQGSQVVNAEALLRARLLDAWLGDWDRHAGQWTWALTKANSDDTHPRVARHPCAPVPKDRDMVFYRADDGLIPWLLTRPFTIRHWTTFKPKYTDPIGLMENGEFLDKRLLNSLTRKDFQRTARAMQTQLTDAVLATALARLPAAVRRTDAPSLLAALQARRAALPAFADRFYLNLARRVSIGGTTGADVFDIWPSADSVRVRVFKTPPQSRLLYERTFSRAETRVIFLEGLGGDDDLQMNEPKDGSGPRSRPRLRFFGGAGQDAQQGHGRVRFRQGSRRSGRAYDREVEE